MDSDGSNLRQLTNNDGAQQPTWSPDSRSIAFFARGDREREIYAIDLDGSNLRQLTNTGPGGTSPSWSPDGRFIAFVSSSRKGFTTNIFMMGADGSNLHNLTVSEAHNWDPTWSPDSRSIAFSSNRVGLQSDIYVIDLHMMDLQVQAAGKAEPIEPKP